ncbi:MAG: hypothetical protein QMD36_03810 [Candidatus Aenigmarchaeota archaeon]|nr:hypothetical protein [Candidatus Aenigmarchaeota archaeon]
MENILLELKQIYKPEIRIVSFWNGLDNERLIAEKLGIDTTYRVVINYAGNRISSENVRMNWFRPPNYVGALQKGKYTTDETTKYIANVMTVSGLRTGEAPNIKKHV